jgi:hypothetical protein
VEAIGYQGFFFLIEIVKVEPKMYPIHYAVSLEIFKSAFFFEKSIEYIKVQRGATLGTLEVYKGD